MRETLRRKLTASLILTALSVMTIVSTCILLGMARWNGQQFKNEIANVLNMEVLSEMNAASAGSPESAALNIEEIIQSYSGQLGLNGGREYALWDASNGTFLGGMDNAAVTNNVIAAMSGDVGDSIPVLSVEKDIAVPINGDLLLVLDIIDHGDSMYDMTRNLMIMLVIALVISIIMTILLSRIFAGAFTRSAMDTAKELRDENVRSLYPRGDWEAMAAAMYVPVHSKPRKGERDRDALDILLPYLQEGYVRFQTDGVVLEINVAAEEMLGIQMQPGETLYFENVFHDVPLPQEGQSMIRGQLRQNNQLLDVVFLELEADNYAAVVNAADGRLA